MEDRPDGRSEWSAPDCRSDAKRGVGRQEPQSTTYSLVLLTLKLVNGVRLLDVDEVSVARTALPHTRSMGFHYVALPEGKGAALVSRLSERSARRANLMASCTSSSRS